MDVELDDERRAVAAAYLVVVRESGGVGRTPAGEDPVDAAGAVEPRTAEGTAAGDLNLVPGVRSDHSATALVVPAHPTPPSLAAWGRKNGQK